MSWVFRFSELRLQGGVTAWVGLPTVLHANLETDGAEYELLHAPPEEHHQDGHGDGVHEVTEFSIPAFLIIETITTIKFLIDLIMSEERREEGKGENFYEYL